VQADALGTKRVPCQLHAWKELRDEDHQRLEIDCARAGYKFHPRVDGVRLDYVIDLLRFVSGMPADLVRRRVELVAENALLRQQLIVAKRKIAGRVMWTPWQRFTIVLAARIAPAWREATLLIQPATILRWASRRIPRVLAASPSKWHPDPTGQDPGWWNHTASLGS
jgi:hypothetical protein